MTSRVTAALAVFASVAQAQPKFTEVTAGSRLTMTHAPAEGFPWMHDLMVSGACVGDFNRDGWPDVFILQGGTTFDCLFINNTDGTFTDVAVSAGVARIHRGAGAAAADFDGDGWDDIYVTSYGASDKIAAAGKHLLYRNNRDGTFTEVAVAAGVNSSGTQITGMTPGWGDFDLDGDLDLYVPTWAGDPQGNRLFRNMGNGTFEDATAAAGVELFAAMGFTPSFADMDGDRWPELLLCGDFTTSQYWIANGDGTFTHAKEKAGIVHDTNAMGHAIADFDEDGLLDWYITNIYEDPPAPLQHGNDLYRNTGGNVFEEIGTQAGVHNGGWGWGTVALDFDHDGWTDILETSGWPFYLNKPARAFLNMGDGTFNDVAAGIGFNFIGQGRALLTLDFDRDGDLDVLMTVNGGPARLWRNDVGGEGRHWLRVELDRGTNPCVAPRGFGARVFAKAGDKTWMRYMDSMTSYLGTSEWTLHFGFGAVDVLDEVRVEWADGGVTVLEKVAVDQILKVESFHRADCERDGDRDVFDVMCFQQAFVSGEAAGDFDRDGDHDLDDLLGFLASYTATSCR